MVLMRAWRWWNTPNVRRWVTRIEIIALAVLALTNLGLMLENFHLLNGSQKLTSSLPPPCLSRMMMKPGDACIFRAPYVVPLPSVEKGGGI
jgi:Mn2+/Fe2+ NRAMP family transporter